MVTRKPGLNFPESSRHTEAVKLRVAPETAKRLRELAAKYETTVSGIVTMFVDKFTK